MEILVVDFEMVNMSVDNFQRRSLTTLFFSLSSCLIEQQG